MSSHEDIRQWYLAVLDSGISATRWGKAAGVAGTTITRFLDRASEAFLPKRETLRRLIESAPASAPAPPATVRQLAGIEGANDASSSVIELQGVEHTLVPRFDASLSAGPGSLLTDEPEPIGHHPIESQWLQSITRATTEHLAIVRVDGDSMINTLQDGDWVLLDLTQKRASREGIYALRVGDDLWVKRLTLNLADRLITIISDNPLYPRQDLPEDDLQILGRVCWVVARRIL